MRDKILDAAARVFSQKGYHTASMDEIAAEAAVAKGSLYYHFGSKSELFRKVAEGGMEDLRRAVRQALELPLPIEDRVAAVIDCVSSLCFDAPDLFSIVISESPEGIEPESWQKLQLAKAGLMDYIAELLREGCEFERIIRPLDFAPATHALIGFISAYHRESIKRGCADRERMQKEIREVVMHGLITFSAPDSRQAL